MPLVSRLVLACLATGLGLLSAAPGSLAQAPTGANPAPVSSQVQGVDPFTYRVGPEDVLEISVWREDTLKKEVLVRPDGGISYPLIGEVQVAGRTVLEIREEITKRLDKFIPEAVVSVTILKTGSQRVYVIGRVNKPGEFPLGRYVDVLQALSMAGGTHAVRGRQRHPHHASRRRPSGGAAVRVRSPSCEATRLDQNIRLRAGDVVVVP